MNKELRLLINAADFVEVLVRLNEDVEQAIRITKKEALYVCENEFNVEYQSLKRGRYSIILIGY